MTWIIRCWVFLVILTMACGSSQKQQNPKYSSQEAPSLETAPSSQTTSVQTPPSRGTPTERTASLAGDAGSDAEAADATTEAAPDAAVAALGEPAEVSEEEETAPQVPKPVSEKVQSAKPQTVAPQKPLPPKKWARGKAELVLAKKAKKGKVAFSHRAHQKRNKCIVCHHEAKPEDEKIEGCHRCHKRAAAGKKLAVKKAFHANCRDCHKMKKKGPTKCKQCHKKAE